MWWEIDSLFDKNFITATDIRVVAAMNSGKTLDELTLSDYERIQREWIRFLMQMMPCQALRPKRNQLQAMLLILNKEIMQPLRNGVTTMSQHWPMDAKMFMRWFSANLWQQELDLDKWFHPDDQETFCAFWSAITLHDEVIDWLAKKPTRGLPVNASRLITLVGVTFRQTSCLRRFSREELAQFLSVILRNPYECSSIRTYLGKRVAVQVQMIIDEKNKKVKFLAPSPKKSKKSIIFANKLKQR